MTTLLLAAAAFSVAYIVNMFYITVFFHRGVAHGAVEFRPWAKRFIAATACWVTGIDPKGWAAQHRLHHRYSDTPQDPHSPCSEGGIWGVAVNQLLGYQRAVRALRAVDADYTSLMKDVDIPVSWITRVGLWPVPYMAQVALSVGVGYVAGSAWVGYAFLAGLMSHPIQGWLVNAFAHRYGYQSFDAGDNSRNNTLVAWFVFGEGYQNNHHAHPESAKFSFKPSEFDAGYGMVRIAKALGVLTIPESVYVPPRHKSPSGLGSAAS